MKHPDMHTFTSAFENIKHIHSAAHKVTLREIVIAESLHKHAEYQEKKSILSFYSSIFSFMKNVKLIGATAAIILTSTVASIFAPSVMAQVVVNNGLEYLQEISVNELKQSGYTIDIDFEGSLTEAKNAKDLRTISETDAIKAFSEESDKSMIIGRTIDTTSNTSTTAVDPSTVSIAKAIDPSTIKEVITVDDSQQDYQPDPRVKKYLQYTNPAGKKVTLGIDKNNLPIIMTVSQ